MCAGAGPDIRERALSACDDLSIAMRQHGPERRNALCGGKQQPPIEYASLVAANGCIDAVDLHYCIA